jgi:inhibitor of cysteine peptidase
MIRALFVGISLALAACTPAQREEAPVAQNGGLPAPTPEGVTLRITAAQNGERIEVPVNQRFAVELVGVPTAGNVWAPAQIPAFITRAGEATGNTSQAQSEPGFVGGSHWEVLMFVATSPGEGELVLVQRRPWETSEPASDTFRVTIVAR